MAKDAFGKTEALYRKHVAQVAGLPEEQRAYYTHLWLSPSAEAKPKARRTRRAKREKVETKAADKGNGADLGFPKPKRGRGRPRKVMVAPQVELEAGA